MRRIFLVLLLLCSGVQPLLAQNNQLQTLSTPTAVEQTIAPTNTASSLSPTPVVTSLEIIDNPEQIPTLAPAQPSAVPETSSRDADSITPTELLPGRVQIEDVPTEKEQKVIDSLFQDKILVLPPQTREIYTDRELRRAWDGNVPHLDTSISRIVARFRRPPPQEGEQLDPTVPMWFDIVMEFSGKELLIRSSHPRSRAMAAGMRLQLANGQQWSLFLEGQHNAGMAVLVPRVALNGQYVRAALLCPRWLYRYKRGNQIDTSLVESEYRLSRALFSVNASVEGSALTAGQVGLARARILTSANIPRSKGSQDENYAIDPRISLNYVPITNEQLPDMEVNGNISAGIKVELELQRQAGFKRFSTARDVVWFKQLSLTNEQPWFVRFNRAVTARVAPGICYMMLAEKGVEHRFTREEFVLPDRLKKAE